MDNMGIVMQTSVNESHKLEEKWKKCFRYRIIQGFYVLSDGNSVQVNNDEIDQDCEPRVKNIIS
jgi:hypothetical protein